MMYWKNLSKNEWDSLKEHKGKEHDGDHTVIYFDMDGTLAKWQKYGDWTKPHYFRDLPENKNIVDLASHLYKQGYDVRVLSKAKHDALDDKYEWIREKMPFIEDDKICFVPLDADKSRFVPKIDESTILIDDYNPNLMDWKRCGGVAIKCITEVNNENTRFMSIYSSKNILKNQRFISMVVPEVPLSKENKRSQENKDISREIEFR